MAIIALKISLGLKMIRNILATDLNLVVNGTFENAPVTNVAQTANNWYNGTSTGTGTRPVYDLYMSMVNSSGLLDSGSSYASGGFGAPVSFTPSSYYNFNSNTNDSVGSKNGTPTSITYTTGKLGDCAVFSGASKVAMPSTSPITNKFTFAGWVRVTAPATRQAIYVKSDGVSSATSSWALEIGGITGSKVNGNIYVGGTVYTTVSTTSVVADTWMHVAFTYDGANIKLYINGTLESTTAVTGNVNNITKGTSFGAYGEYTGGLYMTGRLDGWVICETDGATATDVTTMYNGGTGVDWTALVLDPNHVNGTYGLKLATTSAGAFIEARLGSLSYNHALTTDGFVLQPSTNYRMTWWQKTKYTSGDATNGAFVSVLEHNSSLVNINSVPSTPIKTTTAWTQYTMDFTTNASTAYGHVECRIYGHQGTGTLIMDSWYDDLRLVKL